eukprot:gene23490-29708_t
MIELVRVCIWVKVASYEESGINQKQVDNGVSFDQAIAKHEEWLFKLTVPPAWPLPAEKTEDTKKFLEMIKKDRIVLLTSTPEILQKTICQEFKRHKLDRSTDFWTKYVDLNDIVRKSEKKGKLENVKPVKATPIGVTGLAETKLIAQHVQKVFESGLTAGKMEVKKLKNSELGCFDITVDLGSGDVTVN